MFLEYTTHVLICILVDRLLNMTNTMHGICLSCVLDCILSVPYLKS